MSEVKILGLPPSSYCRTAMMILENKGVDYDFEMVDFRASEYAAHHPFHKVPVLKHSEVSLYETLAIGVYVDEAFEGPALQPSDPAAKAEMFQWISATIDYYYDSFVRHCVTERFVKAMRGIPADEAKIEAAMPVFTDHLAIINDRLSVSDYLAGPEMSLTDMFLAPILVYFAATPEGAALMPSQTAIGAWMQRMAKTKRFDEINKLG